MVVAVDQQHRLADFQCRASQRRAIRRIRIARRGAAAEARLGVADHDQRAHIRARGILRGGRQPAEVVRHPRIAFGRPPCVVLGAGHVEGHEQHALMTPARVLRPLRLALECDACAPHAFRCREECPAQECETLDRIETAGARAVAVGPVVVAGREDERQRRRVEQRAAAVEQFIAARRTAAFQVADVDHERERLASERLERRRDLGFLERVIGRVADHRELEPAVGAGVKTSRRARRRG